MLLGVVFVVYFHDFSCAVFILTKYSPKMATPTEFSKTQEDIVINRELHMSWLKKGFTSLPPNFAGLDASRPWFVFWISHAMEILGDYDEQRWSPQVASFLSHCQDSTGGFAGGPSQLPHLAPTYAAVSALMVAGTEEAYKVVDRATMYGFLMRMKSPQGGFKMHDEGETDMRGCYCAIATASMLHILTDELMEGVPEYIRRCQTWEGGIAGEEGLEAHGGYSYCGLAALCIAGKADALDLHAFLKWAVNKQMSNEGGFQGRANKLVDSCYSFWQGAIFPLLHEAFRQSGTAKQLPVDNCWFSPEPLLHSRQSVESCESFRHSFNFSQMLDFLFPGTFFLLHARLASGTLADVHPFGMPASFRRFEG